MSEEAKAPQIRQANHEFLYGQDLIYCDQQTPELSLCGGVGSGKTYFACVWLHRNALLYPGQAQWFCSHTDFLVKNVCFKTYIRLLNHWGYVQGVHYSTKSNNYLKYANGSEIYFLSAVAYERWVGMSIVAAVLDEPGRYPGGMGPFNEVSERLRGEPLPNGAQRQRLYTGTPQGLTAYMDKFGGDDMKSTERNYTYAGKTRPLLKVSADGTRKALHFPSFFNHTINTKEQLKILLGQYGHDKALVKAHIFGEFIPLHADNCYNITEQNVIDCTPNEEIGNLYLSWDFNVGAMSWTAWQQGPDKRAYCVAECPSRVSRTRDACIEIKKQFPKEKWGHIPVTILGDASGKARNTVSYVNNYDVIKMELAEHFSMIRIKVPKANGPVDLRIEATNLALTRNEYTDRPPMIYFDRACKRVIASMYQTVYNNSGGIAKPSGEDITHPSDTVGYLCDYLFPFKHIGSLGVSY